MPNEVVVITGANNGIGLGLTRALITRGYRVAALDLSTENLSNITAFVCDVADPGQVEAAITQVVEQWGRIDVLVNNACLAVFSPFEQKTIQDLRRELDVNYFGYVNMIKAVLPYMKAQGGGIIHNFSSTVGTSGFDSLSGYASAKGAIEALSRTLSLELRPYGIVVNIVYPPLTRTKSSAPLGIPMQFMADADSVGLKLARNIGSRQGIVTPGLMETIGVFIARVIPVTMGRLMSGKAAAARKDNPTQAPGDT